MVYLSLIAILLRSGVIKTLFVKALSILCHTDMSHIQKIIILLYFLTYKHITITQLHNYIIRIQIGNIKYKKKIIFNAVTPMIVEQYYQEQKEIQQLLMQNHL